MMQIAIEGVAFWSDHLPGWDIAAAAFRGERPPLDEAASRPAPALLPAAERRRAPDTVALGLEVASRALAATWTVRAGVVNSLRSSLPMEGSSSTTRRP